MVSGLVAKSAGPTWRRPGMTSACWLLRRHHPGRGCLLLAMQPVEYAARLDDTRIGIDIRLRRVGNDVQIALLRLEHLDVLEKGVADLLDEHVRGLGVADVEIVCLSPEVMAG